MKSTKPTALQTVIVTAIIGKTSAKTTLYQTTVAEVRDVLSVAELPAGSKVVIRSGKEKATLASTSTPNVNDLTSKLNAEILAAAGAEAEWEVRAPMTKEQRAAAKQQREESRAAAKAAKAAKAPKAAKK